MRQELAISINNVSKCFKRYEKPGDRLKEVLLPRKKYANDFWALEDINLEIYKGQTVGIVGRNGSGKSTLLQIIAQTLTPTRGKLSVNGRVSALLELGSGFNPEFTGRQNVFFNGQILGLSQKEVENKFDEIAAFADIGDFIDEPVKTYSSGMFVRLAFAVAINVNPEILIVDEALSVGDGVFVHRCMAKIKEFQDSNGTILFVSHDNGAISRLCSEVVWLNKGKIIEIGKPFDVCKHYQAWIYKQINENSQNEIDQQYETSIKEKGIESNDDKNVGLQNLMLKGYNPFTEKAYRNFPNVERFGTGKAEIIDFKVLGKGDKPLDLAYPGDSISLKLSIFAHSKIEKPIIGCTIYDRLRTAITAWNTYQMSIEIRQLKFQELLDITFEFTWPELNSGNYLIEPAVADGTQDSHEMLDWLQCAAVINSSVSDITLGIFKLSGITTLVGYSYSL
ncbi:MAG: ABC transporter ATP-binding protein [Microcystis aeruginosa G11-01]|jgi:lipopolysaccharide transport system ATP-binding protein|nr:ABC transporter ATP-binding protein [Microcystis aeruginosa G11-01]